MPTIRKFYRRYPEWDELVITESHKEADTGKTRDSEIRSRVWNNAAAYSTVTKYARSAQFSGQKEAIPPEAPDVEHSPVDEAIFTALAEFPFLFSSVRDLSRRICLPRSTVHRHLTQSRRVTVRHLRWFPTFRRRNRSRFGSRWQSNYCR
jgi:hypothetical protein